MKNRPLIPHNKENEIDFVKNMRRHSFTKMKSLAVVVTFLCLISVVYSQNVWPKPQIQTFSNNRTFSVNSPLNFVTIGFSSGILTQGISRYASIGFYKYPWTFSVSKDVHARKIKADETITTMIIDILTNNEVLQYGTDESYKLDISVTNITLTANTTFGALRGLETFVQLLTPTYAGNGATVYYINETYVFDFPRFGHRGYLIDTARHYLPMSILYQQIDILAYNKYNVIHWHISDDQAISYQSTVWPDLSEGSYLPLEQQHVYTKDQIANIIEFARYRGVRVIPEFDTPAHTISWGIGYPEVLTPCYSRIKDEPTGELYGMYPIANFTYEFVEKLFREVDELFIDDYLHIGGDEMNFRCWESNPNIRAFMQEQGWGFHYKLLENYYEQRVLDICTFLDLDYIVWQDVFDNGCVIKDTTLVEVWKGGSDDWQSEMYNVTAAGYKVLLSSPWYLNYISYGQVWPTYYLVEPTAFNGTTQQEELVVGGEACMWGEFVDSTNSVARTWPNAGAIGERLWSAMDVTDIDDATIRIQDFTCKLIKRNIPCEPPNGPSYCDVEFDLGYNPPY